MKVYIANFAVMADIECANDDREMLIIGEEAHPRLAVVSITTPCCGPEYEPTKWVEDLQAEILEYAQEGYMDDSQPELALPRFRWMPFRHYRPEGKSGTSPRETWICDLINGEDNIEAVLSIQVLDTIA